MRSSSKKILFASLLLLTVAFITPAHCKITEATPANELRSFVQLVSEAPHPTNEQLFEQAKAYKFLKDYKAAIKTMDKLIELLPQNGVAHAFRGSMYKYDDRFKDAKEDFDTAEKLGFNRPSLYAERSAVELVLTDFSSALSDARRAVEAEPENPNHLVLLGSAKLELGKPEDALNDLDRALQLEPNNSSALATRAAINKKLGRPKQASADYARAQSLGWKSPL